MRGRKPKPTQVLKLTGNPGKRPLNGDEPNVGAEMPSCPTHLSDVAKEEWKRIAQELGGSGMIAQVDRAALAAYCQTWATWVEAETALQQQGRISESSRYGPKPSPWVAISNTSLMLMHKFLSEFGMTPSSRTRIKVNAAEVDEFVTFMKKRA